MSGLVQGLAAALLLAGAAVRAEPVAVTFDDLPVFGRNVSTAAAAATTRKLLRGLVARHIPATGFVNEIKLEGADRPARVALLQRWVDAGMDLGNHSYSHPTLTTTPVDCYIADVARGDAVTRTLLAERGRVPHWFRHPYLETGPTLEVRHTFETWLGDHGYRVAPVTMENSDYLFAEPYDDALARGDAAGARQIRRDYVSFSRAIVPWYRGAALGLLGRRPAFVLLLHASRLNADSIGALAAIFRHERLTPTTLDTAMTDPAYALADDYAGPDGEEWLTRWSDMMHKELPWTTLPQLPPLFAAEELRLDPPPAAAPAKGS